MTMERKYRYNRSDFSPLPVKLEHMDLDFNFADGKVEVENTMTMTSRQKLDTLALDARELDVREVSVSLEDDDQYTKSNYKYLRAKDRLVIPLSRRIEAGVKLKIRTSTVCVPSDTILEGIYRDVTPPGCRQQYISQCQQWGFSRIAPVFDDCRAKCTMRTRIEADASYTHLLSNGNIDPNTNPDGKPVPLPGEEDRQTITYDNPVPMSPYLFLVAAGTWDVLEDEVACPSGKKVKLEYLVPPGRKAGAEIPMEILKKAVTWQARTQEYEYRHEVYRTICMEKSNFGGMENVGNTTIVTSAALVDQWTGDRRLKYAHAVIVHEFEHNQCGSDVTMETPFDMWLNEAFTVDVERQFMASMFDPVGCRLDEVDAMRAPVHGPLAIEDAGHLGNIVREGFNDPDELVDAVTYVKAAEVIRMLKLILGEDVFRDCRNAYFSKYNGSNANTGDFFGCFEEVSGRDLSQFRKEWLHTIGYPQIETEYSYDPERRRLELVFEQKRSGEGGLFHLPVKISAVDEGGRDIGRTSRVVELTGEKTEVSFDDVPPPAFVSFNRDCSFYGIFRDKTGGERKLSVQTKLDPNMFNRVQAVRELIDIQRVSLIKDPDFEISRSWLEVMAGIVRDKTLPPGVKASMLHVEEQPLDRDYLVCYRRQYTARRSLLQSLAGYCFEDLEAAFGEVDTYMKTDNPTDGLEDRRLKSSLLEILISAENDRAYRIAESHLEDAWNITDRVSALLYINRSDHPGRIDLLKKMRREWKGHLAAYSSYLAVVAMGVHDDLFDMIEEEEQSGEFSIEHPDHVRSLFLPVATNNRMLWTDRGIEWMADTVIRLAPINQVSAIRLVAAFQQVNDLAEDLKPKVLASLEKMSSGIDAEQCPSVAGRVRAYKN